MNISNKTHFVVPEGILIYYYFYCSWLVDLTYWSLYLLINIFFYAARIGYTFGFHYPMNLNMFGHYISGHHRPVL